VYQNNEMAAILVYGTGISSFLFKYFVLFHHPTGATDHVSENDLYRQVLALMINPRQQMPLSSAAKFLLSIMNIFKGVNATRKPTG
jgi:hypothetical protein